MAWLLFLLLATAALLGGCEPQAQNANTFAMDTLVSQTVYGENAQTAIRQVNKALQDFETRLSLFSETGDIANINNSAGKEIVEVDPETAVLLQKGLALSSKSEGAFALTIAPLTLAWGITGDSPRVLSQEEINALLPLVDDASVQIEENRVFLPRAGMGLDLGGIAKGAACTTAARVYAANDIDSALLSIGGNVYARGKKPDGTPWRIGFRNPVQGENAYIASIALEDEVIAVSGGYERYFEEDGVRYIHIIDPQTGRPAVSDIVSVGVIDPDGAVADFYSTTLFVWGKQRALSFMEAGGTAILLDEENNLYVSKNLRDHFKLANSAQAYKVVFI